MVEQSTNILMKVFSLVLFIENVVVFKEERAKWTALISCFRQGNVYPYRYALVPYLYKCGVLDVICLLPGFTTTFYKPSEISSTLSLYNHDV